MPQVYAVGVSVNVAAIGSEFTDTDAELIEKAMAAAVARCYTSGVTGAEAVKAAMMAAKDAAMEEIRTRRVTL